MSSERSSLVNKASGANMPDDAASLPSPSLITTESIYLLSVLRLIGGAACLLTPTFAGNLFRIPIAPQTTILGRMIGTRNIVLAEYLWFMRGGLTDPTQRAELRHVLLANIAMDTMDVATCIYGLTRGSISRTTTAFVGGGALAFAVIGLVGLRGLKDKK